MIKSNNKSTVPRSYRNTSQTRSSSSNLLVATMMMPISSMPIRRGRRISSRILVISSISRLITGIIMSWTRLRRYPSRKKRSSLRLKNLRAIISSWILSLRSPRRSSFQTRIPLAELFNFRLFPSRMWFKSMSSNHSRNRLHPISIRSSS